MNAGPFSFPCPLRPSGWRWLSAAPLAMVLCGWSLGACKGGPDPQTADGNTLYLARCQACHGADGQATGAAAASLNPKPRNFADKSWQASVTDAQIRTVIAQGGPSIGKSGLMPPQPDLVNTPGLDKLVLKVREFGK